jgi:hypothetical protein
MMGMLHIEADLNRRSDKKQSEKSLLEDTSIILSSTREVKPQIMCPECWKERGVVSEEHFSTKKGRGAVKTEAISSLGTPFSL